MFRCSCVGNGDGCNDGIGDINDDDCGVVVLVGVDVSTTVGDGENVGSDFNQLLHA